VPATGRGNRARVQRHTEAFVAVKCRGAAAVLDPRDRGLDDARALASERGGLAGQNKTSRSGQHHDATSAAGVLGFLSIFVRAVCSGAVETTARTVVVRQFRRRSQRMFVLATAMSVIPQPLPSMTVAAQKRNRAQSETARRIQWCGSGRQRTRSSRRRLRCRASASLRMSALRTQRR
jgi:hypothetical protein